MVDKLAQGHAPLSVLREFTPSLPFHDQFFILILVWNHSYQDGKGAKPECLQKSDDIFGYVGGGSGVEN